MTLCGARPDQAPTSNPGAVAIDRRKVRAGGFLAFVRAAWHVAEPTVDLVAGWHIPLLCQHLEAVGRGEIDRLLINVPPGTGKSLVVSVLWPAWLWIERPWLRIMAASHDDSLAGRDARRFRALVDSDWYQARWGAGQCPGVEGATIDRNGRAHADTVGILWSTAAGFRLSSTVGGKAVGWHAHVQICDDPHKPIDLAPGPNSLERVRTWWDETMSSRLMPQGPTARVIIMQRLHKRDLAGHVLGQGGWHHLCLPMEYDQAHPHVDADDPRTEYGELLCPELKARARVDSERRDLGPVGAAAQLQQLPAPPGGAVFTRSMFTLERRIPTDLSGRWFQSWDLNIEETAGGSFVSGGVWCAAGTEAWRLDAARGRWSFTDACDRIVDMVLRWPQTAREVVIERKANGPATAAFLARYYREECRRRGVDAPPALEVRLYQPHGSKLARANGITGIIEGGHVHLPADAPWLAAYLEEMLRFSGRGAETDDQVDETSQALTYAYGSQASRWADAMRAAQARIRGAA